MSSSDQRTRETVHIYWFEFVWLLFRLRNVHINLLQNWEQNSYIVFLRIKLRSYVFVKWFSSILQNERKSYRNSDIVYMLIYIKGVNYRWTKSIEPSHLALSNHRQCYRVLLCVYTMVVSTLILTTLNGVEHLSALFQGRV